MENKTSVNLTKKNKNLIEQNIPNFTNWVNKKIEFEFDSLLGLKNKEEELLYELSLIQKKIEKLEFTKMVEIRVENEQKQAENEQKQAEIRQKEAINSLILEALRVLKKAKAERTNHIIEILDKIKAEVKNDTELQKQFSRKYGSIIEQYDVERGINYPKND